MEQKNTLKHATITIIRRAICKNTVYGIIHVNSTPICAYIENADKMVANGNYSAYWDLNRKIGMVVELEAKDGRSGIQIHPANYSHELKGCFAPCENVIKDMGVKSKNATNRLFNHLRGFKTMEVIVTGVAKPINNPTIV